ARLWAAASHRFRTRPREAPGEALLMNVKAISADSHMDLTFLPPDTFTSRVPAKFRDRAPRVVDRDGAKYWMTGDDELARYGYYGPGVTGGKRGKILADNGFTSGHTRPSDTVAPPQDQERDGGEAD